MFIPENPKDLKIIRVLTVNSVCCKNGVDYSAVHHYFPVVSATHIVREKEAQILGRSRSTLSQATPNLGKYRRSWL